MTDFLQIKEKVALVTGAGQGLGRAYAKHLALHGAIPVVADINFEAAQNVAREIEQMGARSLAYQVDVANEASVDELFLRLSESHLAADIVINNAAIFSSLKMRRFDDIPTKEWRHVLDVNITGVYLISRGAVPAMREKKWGRIINISSAAWSMGRPNYLHYTTSKAALIGLTRSLAREVGSDGITVNCVLPGATQTEVERETVTPAEMQRFLQMRSIPRLETPEDICGAVLFLASEASGFVTGQSVTIDGGLSYE